MARVTTRAFSIAVKTAVRLLIFCRACEVTCAIIGHFNRLSVCVSRAASLLWVNEARCFKEI